MRKGWLFAALGLALIAAGAFAARQQGIDLVKLAGFRTTGTATTASSGNRQPTPPAQGTGRGAIPVEIARATSAEISDDIAAVGTLLAEESVAIAPETSGRVAAIMFRDGEDVKAGQAMFQLDADLAEADLAEAKARLSLAEATYQRVQTLRKSGNITQSAYDAALTELEVARTAVGSANVRRAKLTVSAPFDGKAGFRSVSVGAYVAAGNVLVQLDKIDLLKVSFAVPELEQSRISIGQTINVTADALPGERFTAAISAIDPAIDVNGRSLRVHAALDNKSLKLRPGLLVRIAVKGPPRLAVMVPETAIVQRGEAAFVYLAKDAKAEEAEVRTGKRIAGAVEIVEGVTSGAEVVVAGNTRLSNGTSIEIVQPAVAD